MTPRLPRGAAGCRLGELRKVIANGRASNLGHWRTLGFLAGNAICLFRPGRYFEPGKKVASRWPDATVENALGRKDSPTRAEIEALVNRHGTYIRNRIYAEISEGMDKGERWTAKHRRLVSGQEAAKRLRVDYEEREELNLRSIGAVDMTPEGLKLEGRRKKRDRDREQKKAERRAAGAQPREEYERNSISKARPWEAQGVSRRTFYRRLKEAGDRVGTSPSPHNKEPYGFLDKSLGDTPVPRHTPTDHFSIEDGHQPAICHSPSLGNSSDSEKAIQLAALEKDIAQRLPAPPCGAGCRQTELSLSDRALLALYARERSSGRIREAVR